MRLGPSRTGGARLLITEREEEKPTRRPKQIDAEVQELFGPVHATMWLMHCQSFWAYLDGAPPDKVVATLPAKKHREALEVLDRLGTLVKEFQQRFWEAGRPKLVGKEGGDQTQ